MFDISTVELDWKGLSLKLETGLVARQADGAVTCTLGGTVVLCTVSASREVDNGKDFFPLSVHYIEKAYSAGKIPGGFFKREGRPAENEILSSRLIDRPIRPLFHSDFKNETQVICTVINYDGENDPSVCAMIGASAAITISGLPFLGPLACARVGYMDGEYILNPTKDEQKESELDLVVAGTREGVLMVESEADQLDEKIMLGAVQFGFKEFQIVIDKIIELAEKSAKESWKLPEKTESSFFKKLQDLTIKEIAPLYKIKEKKQRNESLNEARKKIVESFNEESEEDLMLKDEIKQIEKDIVRSSIIKTKKRIDGRGLDDVRAIDVRVDFLENVHGSALFTRGETQALVATTLGTTSDEQMLDTLDGDSKAKFMLHYNFPPFSVNEVGRIGSTGRREVGHGKLAWRAINPVLKKADEFPYTIRVVSEITESNGSSSMATVCGSSLALMDAGVPLEKPIAGIAMGLIKEENDFVVLTDILGDEDHLGDMDFKVAGTEDGITSLQMDIKVDGITNEIMKQSLSKAYNARIHILKEMNKVLKKPRSETKSNTPQIIKIKIDKSKIREVIGSGGKVIKDICEKSGAKVEIDDDGVVTIFASKLTESNIANDMINDIVAEPEVGKIYEGKVVKTTDFGAFVNFMGSRDGLVHISQLKNERVEKTTDVVKEGEIVKVKVIGVDERGKVKLSIKDVQNEKD
ncbi:MAG: polyribonucleotide nucleotidyltransferase [Pelagibacteraceae bacterium TMED65]|nr:polyribonucleotide nucleotidyltransferase [Rickettsiales bacterium]OUU52025.1 MAG: polyribonucleotide nucleotidyltransferase [Pelagibacteraceae bacterium TMED65]|tara:strand:- start:397 stop:2481 length:2085 start_codon:yes stop_codon:yes gene_type:complete